MEATRDNHNRFGTPVRRERSGHENAEDLFSARRERQFRAGLMSDAGFGGRYVLFRPSRVLLWVLGDTVVRLNDALYGFRRLAHDHLMLLDGDGLSGHYGELGRRVEAVRDRLVALTEYCNKGFEGHLDEALEHARWAGVEGSEAETGAAAIAPYAEKGDVFESHRQRQVEVGILTALGREEGWVALRPCPFHGRLMGEMVCTLNDALGRVEGRMAADIMTGREEGLRQYIGELQKGMTELRVDLEGIIDVCKRKVA